VGANCRRCEPMKYLGFLLLAAAPLAATDYYKLDGIKKIDQDLYKSGKVLVETRFCFHITVGEDAILKYEGEGEFSGSKVIWADETTCDVKKVIVR